MQGPIKLDFECSTLRRGDFIGVKKFIILKKRGNHFYFSTSTLKQKKYETPDLN